MYDFSDSATILTGERGFSYRVLIQVEADHGTGRVFLQRQLIHLQREHRKDIAMRFVAFRRARSPVTRLTEIGHRLYATCWCSFPIRLPSPGGKRCCIRRNVEDDPVPPATTGRRIRIIDRHGKTLRSLWCSLPPQLGRRIVPAAAEPVEDMLVADSGFILDRGTREPEVACHADARKYGDCQKDRAPCTLHNLSSLFCRIPSNERLVWMVSSRRIHPPF